MKEKEPNRYREEENENNQTVENNETTEEVNDENEATLEESSKEDNLESKKETVEEELKKVTNSYLRVLADFENFKKRTNDERVKERKYFNQGLFERLITIFDIFDKAVNMQTDDEKLKNFLMGFKMINDNFKQILESEGVKKIEALGKNFDPAYHHAIEVEWDETKEENIILNEMQTGYMFKDRLLRPSLVKVNQKTKGNENNG